MLTTLVERTPSQYDRGTYKEVRCAQGHTFIAYVPMSYVLDHFKNIPGHCLCGAITWETE